MHFNLIDLPWIPVRRRDGFREAIAPWQMVSDHQTNPVVALDAPRPDFNGALIQFLIGLVQTAAPPKDEDAWFGSYEEPPDPDRLRNAFAAVADAFWLDGDGHRFLQDVDPLEGEEWEVGSLLIEMPGDNTVKRNTDFFVKRGQVGGLCPSCTAAALFTLQTNGPAGGKGHRTGLRGGGPITTLVLSDTLWRTVWLNVLEEARIMAMCGSLAKTALADRFPWMGPTRTSEGGSNTTPLDVHPAQMYWGMPRRIRLSFDEGPNGVCDLCGLDSRKLIRTYRTRPYGANFEGAWPHPLTPIRIQEGVPFPVHGQPGGMYYRHWLGLVQKDENREPAFVVHHFLHSRQRDLPKTPFRVWAFGYDLDNMKPRCWYESTMPLVHVEESVRDDFEDGAAGLVKAAGEIGKNLRVNLKKAWFRRPADHKGDLAFIDASFWQRTEGDFYASLESLNGDLMGGKGITPAMRAWHGTLCRAAESVFDLFARSGPVSDADPKRIALALRDMRLGNNGKRVRDLLRLPVKESGSGNIPSSRKSRKERSER